MNGRGLPDSVRIREVGPRDGFQNEPEVIPTAEKVRLIDLLSATGLRRIEVTSFVRPDVIPQLADAEEVLASIERRDGVSYSVLIPNVKGLERALGLEGGCDEATGSCWWRVPVSARAATIWRSSTRWAERGFGVSRRSGGDGWRGACLRIRAAWTPR